MSILQRARSSDRLAPYLRALVRVGLPAWFVVIDFLWILKPLTFAIDARNYQGAAAAWLSGGNPWQTIEMGVRYGSGPHTLLFYAPTSLIPFEVAVGLWMVAGLAAAVWVVRRLELPIWWVAFPPLLHAIWNGNPQTVMLAFLVLGHPIASAAAAGVKLYALVQLIFRPRHLAVAIATLALSTIILPWQLYLASADSIAENMLGSWDGSAARVPILLVPTVAALFILRKKDGQWWSIPAVWPATQFYYVATVLPAVSTRPILAALTAIPVPLMVPAIVIGLGVREVHHRRRIDEPAASSVAPAAT